MPRFHINVYNGVDIPDPGGTELIDWQAARLEAIRYAGEVLKSDATRVGLGHDWHMNVTDDRGLVLCRMDFIVIEAAATMNLLPAEILQPRPKH